MSKGSVNCILRLVLIKKTKKKKEKVVRASSFMEVGSSRDIKGGPKESLVKAGWCRLTEGSGG